MSVVFSGQFDHGVPDRIWFQSFMLAKIVERYVTRVYCETVEEFAPIWRVEGTYSWSWFLEGVCRIRRSHLRKYISCDIGVSKRSWKSLPNQEFKVLLGKYAFQAFDAFCKRIKKDGEDVDEEAMLHDICVAIDEFHELTATFEKQYGLRCYTGSRVYPFLEHELAKLNS
jgi:hypothetical protein